MHFFIFTVAVLSTLTSFVAGHGAIIKAVGDQGGQGSALGIDPTTPRTGTTRDPFQRDTTILPGGKNAAGCGKTIEGGQNNIENGTTTILNQNGGTLPLVSSGGQLTMTLHQVNGDGAGPYTCALNTDGTAKTWTQLQVTANVPGKNGNSNAKATDFPLVAQLPANLACTGTVAGQQNVCIVRCENPVGPFGGCVPVQAVANNVAGGQNGANGGCTPQKRSVKTFVA